MKPSLDNAYARAHRAKRHLMSLKGEASKYWRSFHLPEVYMEPRAGGTTTITWGQDLIPSIFSILVGETIYNLRATLDYLVYQLAILDSGQSQEETQFPIEHSEGGWEKSMNGKLTKKVPDKGCRLRGLNESHKERIKLLQPCFGCCWTGILQKFSNPDKHKTLTIVKATQIVSMEPTSQNPVIIDPSKEGKTILFSAKMNPPNNSKNMNTDVSLEITFDDGSPVIQTLQSLRSNIIKVLDEFKPDFD